MFSTIDRFKNYINEHLREIASKRLWNENYRRHNKESLNEWYEEIIKDAFPPVSEYYFMNTHNSFIKKFKNNSITFTPSLILEMIRYIERNRENPYLGKTIRNFSLKNVIDEYHLMQVYIHIYSRNNLEDFKNIIDAVTKRTDSIIKKEKISRLLSDKIESDQDFNIWIHNQIYPTNLPALQRQDNEPVFVKYASRCVDAQMDFEDILKLYKQRHLNEVKVKLEPQFDREFTPERKRNKNNDPPEMKRRSKRLKK